MEANVKYVAKAGIQDNKEFFAVDFSLVAA